MSNTLWQHKSVSELIDGLTAGVSVRSSPGVEFGPAILKTSAVDRGRFVPSEAKTILAADLRRARCNPVGDSMILSRMNTPAMVGDVGYVAESWPELFLPDRLWMARARRRSGTSMRWLTYYFASEPGARELRGLATGTSGSMKNIPKDRILNLDIATPPPAEQRAIASALADTDALIETLEVLLAKKRNVKQGMMQELLTGRVRLPGHTGPWEECPAGDIGYFKGGSGFPTRYQGKTSGQYPFFKVSDMNSAGNELFMSAANNYISDGVQRQIGANVMPAGAIVFAKVGAAVFLERKRILLAPSCIDNNMSAFVVDAGRADVRFVHYALTNFPMASLVATGALPSLNGRQLRSILLAIPTDLGEQAAIARVLADADSEIAALQRRLQSVCDLKTGMMQELLTGRTRLPVEAAS